MAGTTSKGLRYPTSLDPVNVAVDIQNLAEDIDTELSDYTTTANSGTTVNAPLTNSGTSQQPNLSVSAASTSASGVVQLTDSTSTTSSTVAATATAVKSAYDRGSTGISDAAAAQSTANAAIPKSVVTTEGDIIYATGNAAVTRLPRGSNGQVLTLASGVPAWGSSAGGGTLNIVEYTSSATWTRPSGVNYLQYVIVCGAGGGGGGGAGYQATSSTSFSARGGGSGGGSRIVIVEGLYVGDQSTISIGIGTRGTGGAGGVATSAAGSTTVPVNGAGSNGVAGGTTTFGSYVSIAGGGAGGGGGSGSGGSGGTAGASAGNPTLMKTWGIQYRSWAGQSGSTVQGPTPNATLADATVYNPLGDNTNTKLPNFRFLNVPFAAQGIGWNIVVASGTDSSVSTTGANWTSQTETRNVATDAVDWDLYGGGCGGGGCGVEVTDTAVRRGHYGIAGGGSGGSSAKATQSSSVSGAAATVVGGSGGEAAAYAAAGGGGGSGGAIKWANKTVNDLLSTATGGSGGAGSAARIILVYVS